MSGGEFDVAERDSGVKGAHDEKILDSCRASRRLGCFVR